AVALERVVGHLVSPRIVVAALQAEGGHAVGVPTDAVGDRWRRAGVRVRIDGDRPAAVVGEPVVDDRVVASAGDDDPAARPSERGAAFARDIGVVVVVDVVVLEHPARVGPDRSGAVAGAGPVLWRRRVVVVLAVGGEPGLVVVELRVLHHEV